MINKLSLMKLTLILDEEGNIFVNKRHAQKLIEQGYGFIEGDYLKLENYEALYLIFKNLASLFHGEREMSFDEAIKYFIKKDKRVWGRFLVYMKLREKNYIVRKGYGDRYDFLLYEKGSSFDKEAPQYIVSIVHEGESLEMDKLNEMLAFAMRMRKKIIFAVIDSNSDVSFYEASKISL